MNSINAEQQEQTQANLHGTEAVAKVRELVKQATTCFFCTAITTGQPVSTRPMAVQQVDDHGGLWFLSASDSTQNMEIAGDRRVQLLFQGSPHSDFMTLSGSATITTDKAKIKELWSPILKTWFTDGIDDPRITAIRVLPDDGYYWDTKHGHAVAFVKMVIGAISGKTMDDSIEGLLRV